MMKKVSWMLMCMSVAATVWGGLDPTFLPSSTHYQGRNSFAINDGGNLLQGHVEFAVYDTEQQTLSGYTGAARYVYAYQVFSYSSSTAPLMYFSLLGANFSGINLNYDDALGGGASGGVTPSGTRVEGSTKAIWDFANGTLVKSERSWFLFFYSDSDWVKGSYEVKATYNDDVPRPQTPEPGTLLLLAGGAILSLMRKR